MAPAWTTLKSPHAPLDALSLLRGPTFSKNRVLVLLDMNMSPLTPPALVSLLATVNQRKSLLEIG
jgi:hypothetical protein